MDWRRPRLPFAAAAGVRITLHRQYRHRDVVGARVDPGPDKRWQAAGEGCVEIIDSVVEDEERSDAMLEGGRSGDEIAAQAVARHPVRGRRRRGCCSVGAARRQR
jgi:hypothetical protein